MIKVNYELSKVNKYCLLNNYSRHRWTEEVLYFFFLLITNISISYIFYLILGYV